MENNLQTFSFKKEDFLGSMQFEIEKIVQQATTKQIEPLTKKLIDVEERLKYSEMSRELYKDDNARLNIRLEETERTNKILQQENKTLDARLDKLVEDKASHEMLWETRLKHQEIEHSQKIQERISTATSQLN